MANMAVIQLTSSLQDKPEPILDALDDLRQLCQEVIAQVKANHPWTDQDGRIIVFHRTRNVIQSGLALLLFQRRIFPEASFWQAFFHAVPTPAEFTDHYRECDVMIRFGVLHGLFSSLESHIRCLVQAMDPRACAGGTANFEGIASWLLQRVTGQHFSELITLLRLSRNTIHTNGIYRPTNRTNRTVSYKGVTYAFTVDKHIDFVSWTFVCLVAREIIDLQEFVVTQPVVAGLQVVTDPI